MEVKGITVKDGTATIVMEGTSEVFSSRHLEQVLEYIGKDAALTDEQKVTASARMREFYLAHQGKGAARVSVESIARILRDADETLSGVSQGLEAVARNSRNNAIVYRVAQCNGMLAGGLAAIASVAGLLTRIAGDLAEDGSEAPTEPPPAPAQAEA